MVDFEFFRTGDPAWDVRKIRLRHSRIELSGGKQVRVVSPKLTIRMSKRISVIFRFRWKRRRTEKGEYECTPVLHRQVLTNEAKSASIDEITAREEKVISIQFQISLFILCSSLSCCRSVSDLKKLSFMNSLFAGGY